MNGIRAMLCETFLGWSMRICPKGYSPSYVEAVLIAYERGLKNEPLGRERTAQSNAKDAA